MSAEYKASPSEQLIGASSHALATLSRDLLEAGQALVLALQGGVGETWCAEDGPLAPGSIAAPATPAAIAYDEQVTAARRACANRIYEAAMQWADEWEAEAAR